MGQEWIYEGIQTFVCKLTRRFGEEECDGAHWQHYLEIMELDCDWLEDVVAALSWEKPLWLDSRLVIEPLGERIERE
ncbi:hypothetical protein GN956_G26535, partial [Arapaima gigas]